MNQLFHRFAGSLQLLFVVAVVGGAVLLSIALKPEGSASYPAPASQSVSVSVITPDYAPYRPIVRLNGVVATRTNTDIIPQVSGRVVEVSSAFRPGASMAKGDLLFRIDPADYELSVERTLAEIEAARSELALLEAQSAAERKIWDQQFPDRKIPDLIARVPQIAAAEARIHSAEAARDAAELALQRTVVRSPFDARVLDTRLEIGQVINTGNVVGSVFSIESLEISVPISMPELALIGDPIGQPAAIVREGISSSTLTGQVVRKAAALNERTRLGTLFIAAASTESLTLGEFVNVEIIGQAAAQAYRVPPVTLTSRDQIWVVKNGQLEERRVEVLGNENGFAVVAKFDMADGVVAVPPADVRAGLPVTVLADQRLATTGGGSAAGSP